MTYKKKLIEVALPLAAVNAESARQKTMGAAPHPQNLHRWWARRPLAATRAVLWASLVDDPSAHPDLFPTMEDQLEERKRLFDILERLVPWEANNHRAVLAEARAEIVKSCGAELPSILDPFAGGGAIPLEALRLGLPTFAGDLNPVAVVVQRAMVEIPSAFANKPPVGPDARSTRTLWDGARGLAADVESYGAVLQSKAKARIGQHYADVVMPDGSRGTPVAWIWARTVPSPDPAWPGDIPLVRSWVLSKKPGKPVIWVDPVVDHDAKTVRYEVRRGGTPPGHTVDRGNGICIATGAPFEREYVVNESKAGHMKAVCLAVAVEGPSGRDYMASDGAVGDIDRDALEARSGRPPIAHHPRNVAPGLYGLDSWVDLFTPRQLLALLTFSDLLAELRPQIETDALSAGLAADGVRLRDGGRGAAAYADAVTTYLALVIDRCADNWSSACSWHVRNGQTKQTFASQTVPMTWDFAEVNPFSGRMASWDSMLGGVVRAIPTLPCTGSGDVAQRDARARIREVGTAVVSTDPPYYDNISYADLSDFFYIWLRRNLSDVWPDECATLLTPKADELIANQYRAGSKQAATKHFETGMEEVFREAVASAHPDFPTTIFYAFKATESSVEGITSTGWETFLKGLLDAGHTVVATWPIRTETVLGIKAGKSVLASSIVLACRPRSVEAPMATRGEFIAALRTEMEPAVRLLQLENIAPVDLAQSAIGPGIAIFSRYARVVEADGSPMSVRAALGLVNEILGEILSGEESEFDADTRFALTWFEQYGHNPGPFGDADLLARAKDTTVVGVAHAGVVQNRDGKVRLVERSELPDSWDPATDPRLTVWETTQQLIRALDSSELEAAALLARIGQGLGDRARQLAYLLYGVCDRKKWAEEAGAYNMLVTAWPEVSRLSAAGPTPADPTSLFS